MRKRKSRRESGGLYPNSPLSSAVGTTSLTIPMNTLLNDVSEEDSNHLTDEVRTETHERGTVPGSVWDDDGSEKE